MSAKREAVRDAFSLDDDSVPLFEPRYNIAPTQPVAIVRQPQGDKRQCVFVRWGLIPSWAKDPGIGNSLINARAETVETREFVQPGPPSTRAWKRRNS